MAEPAMLSRHADENIAGAFGSGGVLAAAEPIAVHPLVADTQGAAAVEAGRRELPNLSGLQKRMHRHEITRYAPKVIRHVGTI
jgi:hypothetical protein